MMELFKLSLETVVALCEALQNPETYAPQVRLLALKTEQQGTGCEQCLSIRARLYITITFTEDDLLLDDVKHNRPLYFTGYVREVKTPRIQIDPGSAINIIPIDVTRTTGIPLSTLKSYRVSIERYDRSSQKVLGKVRLKYELEDLGTFISAYVIDAETSYNLLLGRPWIHESFVVPSTLHQCFKYVDEKMQVHRHFADLHPFQGVEAYYVDSKLYEVKPTHEVEVGPNKQELAPNVQTLRKQPSAITIPPGKKSASD